MMGRFKSLSLLYMVNTKEIEHTSFSTIMNLGSAFSKICTYGGRYHDYHAYF